MKALKIQTLSTGWHDRDEILLHGAFQVLVDFVEKESPERVIDWNATENLRHALKEIKTLYRWWKERRPTRRSPLDGSRLRRPRLKFRRIPGSEMSELVRPDRRKYAPYYRALEKHRLLEDKWLEEDQRNLHRLIEIRGFLWT